METSAFFFHRSPLFHAKWRLSAKSNISLSGSGLKGSVIWSGFSSIVGFVGWSWMLRTTFDDCFAMDWGAEISRRWGWKPKGAWNKKRLWDWKMWCTGSNTLTRIYSMLFLSEVSSLTITKVLGQSFDWWETGSGISKLVPVYPAKSNRNCTSSMLKTSWFVKFESLSNLLLKVTSFKAGNYHTLVYVVMEAKNYH